MSILPVDTSPEGIWSMSETVFTYGPATLFVICCTTLPILLLLLLRKDDTKYSWIYRGLITVVVFFGLFMGFFFAQAWRIKYIYVKDGYRIDGVLKCVPDGRVASSHIDGFFFRRLGVADRMVSYNWTIIKDKPFDDNDEYAFVVGNASSNTLDPSYECRFQVKTVYIDKNVVIELAKGGSEGEYSTGKGSISNLVCKEVGASAEMAEKTSTRNSSLLDIIFPSAFAEGNASGQIEDVIAMLYDFDPGIRVTGYDKLVELRGTALPWILETIDNKDEPLQVRLAAISALLAMPEKDLKQFTDSDVAKVVALTADPEEAFRGRAIRFLVKHRKKTNWNILGALERQLAEAEAKGQERTMAWTARAMMEVLYNLGVERKDAYSKKKIQNLKPIEDAVALFAEAWELRRYAYGDDIYFIKPLYGWGHTLHDKAFFYRAAPDGSIPKEFNKEFKQDPELVKAARDKFQEFLDAYDKCQDKDLYPHPHQLEKARKYIDNPVPESLR